MSKTDTGPMRRQPSGSLASVMLLLMIGTAAACTNRQPDAPPLAAIDSLRAAYDSRESGFMVTVPGRVIRILADDEEGSRHQRFVIEIGGAHTLLVSHNIDLAPRAPVREGDSIVVRGQYEWNERGGVLHWTHRDPAGIRPGGWIRRLDAVYR